MPCMKKNCMYHTDSTFYGCNYFGVTGMTKLGSMPIGEKYTIENCPFYKRGRRQRASLDPPIAGRREFGEIERSAMAIDSEVAFFLYDEKLCDNDIAMLIGTYSQAVAKWRKRHGIVRSSNSQPIKVNWDNISGLIKDNRTDAEISERVNIKPEIISMYRETLKTKGIHEDETTAT